nr:putative molybdenum carrier protein [Nitrosovibrio tenuis]
MPERYSLRETPARRYAQRTQWNVRDSDATLIISLSAELAGGSLATQEWANKMNRPRLHVYPCNEWRAWLRTFTETHPIRVLNVAGPRLSGAANIEQFVDEVLDEIFIHCFHRNQV